MHRTDILTCRYFPKSTRMYPTFCIYIPILDRVGHGPAADIVCRVVCSLADVAKPQLPAQATKPLFVTTHEEKFSEEKKKNERSVRTKFLQPPKKSPHLASINNPTRHVTSAMTFLILTETSAGYALFKAKDKKLLKKDDLASEMSTPEGAAGLYVALSTAFGWTMVPREL